MKPGALRITGGTARGAKLFSVEGPDVRPALARMRTSVFEILRARIVGARVVDLFAGNGTLGLEALSRGAAYAIFFDTDPRCIDVIQKNLVKLRLADCAGVRQKDAFEAWEVVGPHMDIVFVDPPYALYDAPETRSKLEGLVRDAHGAQPLIVVEHPKRFDPGDSWGSRKRIDWRRYGGTHVSFYE